MPIESDKVYFTIKSIFTCNKRFSTIPNSPVNKLQVCSGLSCGLFVKSKNCYGFHLTLALSKRLVNIAKTFASVSRKAEKIGGVSAEEMKYGCIQYSCQAN